MLKNKKGFTLLEVLISIALLSLVLMALYRSADILRVSNRNLFHYLEKSSDIIKGANTLYLDVLKSDGNITINSKKKFHHIIIENSRHSLYSKTYSKTFNIEGGLLVSGMHVDLLTTVFWH